MDEIIFTRPTHGKCKVGMHSFLLNSIEASIHDLELETCVQYATRTVHNLIKKR